MRMLRGAPRVTTQEAECNFSGFIPTNKQTTNKAGKANVRVVMGSAAADACGRCCGRNSRRG